MFDRQGNLIKYDTEEEMLAVLRGDRLKPDLREIFEQAMVVDAASHGWHVALDYMLQEMGFSPDDHDHKNYTPIGYAAMVGRHETVKKLLDEYNADPTMCNNAGRSMYDGEEWFEGYTALELALEGKHNSTAFAILFDFEMRKQYLHEIGMSETLITERVVELMGYSDSESPSQETILNSLDALIKKERAKCNWLKAREAVIKHGIVWYWLGAASHSNFERDRQTEVEAMEELMPIPSY